MIDDNSAELHRERKASWWKAVLGDAHFWVPVVVLAAGLLVLRWIS
jgi:hypothetical protein